MGGAAEVVTLVVPAELAGERTDRIVAVLASVARAEARGLIESGAVTVNGAVVKPRARLDAGAVIELHQVPETFPLVPEETDFGVVFEDEEVAVVDKPSGMVVHPGAGRERGTLAAGLLHRWKRIEGVGEPGRWGLVHRLDRETSGLLVVGLTERSHRRLVRAVAGREVRRLYLALARGRFDIPTGTVDAPLGRDPRNPARVAVVADGRPARTHYRRLAAWDGAGVSLVQVELETGRTHQIRVHFSSIGHPIVGDRVYGTGGPAEGDPGRLWLHARALEFVHPVDGREIKVESPLPADLVASLETLGRPDTGSIL